MHRSWNRPHRRAASRTGLTGTHIKSSECPADTLSQDRIEVYTDVRSVG
jgi:hypothetical protein